jgi:hypothetical protein
MAVDTNNASNFNRYAYAANSPYKFTDPDGRSIWTKLAKFAKNGGDIAQTTAGLVEDFAVASNSAVPFTTRLGASISMASEILPISVGDLKDGYKYAKEIKLNVSKHGEAAEHARDAIAQGKPDVLTIARPGAPANRADAIGDLEKVPGKQLDEYPPAMFAEGGGRCERSTDQSVKQHECWCVHRQRLQGSR